MADFFTKIRETALVIEWLPSGGRLQKAAANLGIDVKIPGGVIATQDPARAQAFAGDTRINIEPGAQFGCSFTASPHTFDSIAAGHGDRRPVVTCRR